MSLDLLRVPILGTFLRWKHARTALQSVLLLLAALVVLDGLLGPRLAPRNLAGTLPWVHWRGFLVVALLVAGNLFCMGCPFMLPRRLAKRILPGERPWPRALRSKWLAVGLLLVFFWAYEAFDLWASPWLTAWIVVTYFAAAFAVDGFFRGAAFCKYVCPIGQFNFVNGLVSPAEVRVRDPDTCASCRTKDCIRGRYEHLREETRPLRVSAAGVGLELPDPAAPAGPHASSSTAAPAKVRSGPSAAADAPSAAEPRLVQNGCELWLFQPRKSGNMDCTFCLDCIQACPWDNIGIVYRTPGVELATDPIRSGVGRFSQRTDLAALAVLLTFAAFVNAFGMVAPVHGLLDGLTALPGLGRESMALAGLFLVGLVLLPLLLVGGAAALTRILVSGTGRLREVATRYAWALVPVGFGMWLAHYLYHFLVGGLAVAPALAARIPGLAAPSWTVGPAVPESWLLPIQLLLLEAGALLSVVVAHRIARRIHGSGSSANRAFAPWAGLAVLLSLAGMWLLSQPMEMRGMIGG